MLEYKNMQPLTFIALYAISVPIFFFIDMLWLGLVASNFYKQQIGYLMGDIHWLAAIIFYLIFLAGLVFFAIYPAVLQNSLKAALLLGALFGFFTYATYDLTNLATIKHWPIAVTVVDIIWGTVLGAMVSSISYAIYTYFF